MWWTFLAAQPEPVSFGFGWALLKMVLVLAIVCVLAYVAIRYGLKRLLPEASSSGIVKLVDRCPVGPGRFVCVVECEQRRFLVGVTEQGITHLAELTPRKDEA